MPLLFRCLLRDPQLYQHCANTNVSSAMLECMALAFCAVFCFKSLLIFSPLSPSHVFTNMRLFLLCFPSVSMLDFIVIYLLTFFLLLMVLLLTVRYHKRLNTSVYKRCPSGFFQACFYILQWDSVFLRPFLDPGK